MDAARKSIAAALGCDSGELVFTSCGSESDNWALWSGAEYVDVYKRQQYVHVAHFMPSLVHQPERVRASGAVEREQLLRSGHYVRHGDIRSAQSAYRGEVRLSLIHI